MKSAEREICLNKLVYIDDQEYKLSMFMPSKAFKLGARVAKVIGEPLAAMASAAGDEYKVNDSLVTAARALFSRLDETEVWVLVQELLRCASQDGRLVDIELHFQGRLGSLLKLVLEILEYQFADFMQAIGQAVAVKTNAFLK